VQCERDALPLLRQFVTMRGATAIEDDSVLSWDAFMAAGDTVMAAGDTVAMYAEVNN
jgi:hypothetical protein